MRPNLFHFATSELSQDAVLCWMLAWAKPEYASADRQLHQTGRSFLTMIYERAGVALPSAINSVQITKQPGNIDILCIVNNETAIIIEDKAGTKEHSDQLARYKAFATERHPNIIPVYIQTGEQSDYGRATSHGYLILLRRDLLELLESENGAAARQQSDILDSFAIHLRTIEDDVQSFRMLPLSAWSWNSWKGFYACLQTKIPLAEWASVPNAAGGFLAFYWHFRGKELCKGYLLLDQKKLCFKINVSNSANRRALREAWHRMISSASERHGLRIRRPNKFGSGANMTVAVLDQEFCVVDDHGRINIEATVELLHRAEAVLDEAWVAAGQTALLVAKD